MKLTYIKEHVGYISAGVLLVGVATVIAVYYPARPQVVCTFEAKVCPDRSVVVRTGPLCEFAACPEPPGQANIIIYSPVSGQGITSPVTITGVARTFEQAFSYRVKDENGAILVEGHGTANATDIGIFGPFEASANYPTPKGTRGTIEVFEYSAKDGSEINKDIVNVHFYKDTDPLYVKLFFGNKISDPSSLDCGRTYPAVRQITRTPAVLRASIEELLKGVTKTETTNGFFTSVPAGVKLNRATLENGVALLDFSAELNQIAGSCRVSAIRSQITQTAKQFPSVTGVTISVNGQSEDVLQP